MGCGACQISSVKQSHKSLHRRLKEKISFIRQNKAIIINDQTFIKMEDIFMIQKSLQPVSQHLQIEHLYSFEAGGNKLLSDERRTVWKLAIYEFYESYDIHSKHLFTDTPQPQNQSEKSRFYEISLDVKRTFPQINQINRDNLSIVLQNLTLYFEGVGYTQGMNFFVGFLLLCGFTPAESFEFFIRLSFNSRYLLIRNFIQNFKNVNACVQILKVVMLNSRQEKMRQVIDKMEQFGLNLFMFTFSWFLSYFLYNLNIRASVLVWDYLLVFNPLDKPKEQLHEVKVGMHKRQNSVKTLGNGFVNLLNLAYQILRRLADKIVQVDDIEDLMGLLRHQSIQHEFDEKVILDVILKCKAQPIIDQREFFQQLQKFDKEMFQLIKGGESIYFETQQQESYGKYCQFFDDCKFIKRKNQKIEIQAKQQIQDK